jgi:hypothetical protein
LIHLTLIGESYDDDYDDDDDDDDDDVYLDRITLQKPKNYHMQVIRYNYVLFVI